MTKGFLLGWLWCDVWHSCHKLMMSAWWCMVQLLRKPLIIMDIEHHARLQVQTHLTDIGGQDRVCIWAHIVSVISTLSDHMITCSLSDQSFIRTGICPCVFGCTLVRAPAMRSSIRFLRFEAGHGTDCVTANCKAERNCFCRKAAIICCCMIDPALTCCQRCSIGFEMEMSVAGHAVKINDG